jgi:hypothetical protein
MTEHSHEHCTVNDDALSLTIATRRVLQTGFGGIVGFLKFKLNLYVY